MILQVLEITAPVFTLVAIGFLWARRGLPYDVAFVTRLGTQLAVPCLIFSTLVRAEIDAAAVREVLGATLALYAAFALVFAAALRLAGLSLRTFLPPTVFNNTGNLGLAIAFYAYGDYGLALGIVIFALMVALQFSVGLWFVAGAGKGWEAARQPMVWAAILGLAASLSGFEPPRAVDNALALIGQMGIPLMVLTLGVSISRIAVASVYRAAAISLLRFAAAAGLGVAVASTVGLTGAAFSVLVIQAVMPAPVTNYLIALKYDAEPDEVASLVFVSTLLTLVLTPLTLALLL